MSDSVLPFPPSDEQKFSYVKRHVWLLNVFTLCSFAAVAFSTLQFSHLSGGLWPFVVLIGLSAIGLALSLQADLFSRDFDDVEHRRHIADWAQSTGTLPTVDVFLPICGEDRAVLLNTWRHVIALDYPHLTVYCLDDGGDESIRSVAEEFGFRYLRRDNPGWFKKAGNLQFAYENSSGEFILILDADFAPRPDFLYETLPYFASEPDLGIVQTPQFFGTSKRQNWVERGAGAVQELFYRVVQVSRAGRDAAICVGTCAVYRRDALDSNGGTTLIEHSEDIHTGFDLRRRGWRLRYVPVNLATGLCPDNVPAFFRQQYRWCMGSLSLCISGKFWSTKLPPRTRMCYLAGFAYYLLTALAILTAPLIPLILTIFFPGRIRLVNYLVLLPALLWLYVVLPLWHRSRFRWETLSVKVAYGWAHAFAILDLVRRRPMAWRATGERARDHRLFWFRVLAMVWSTGTGAALIAACLWQIGANGYSALQFAPMLALDLLYLATSARLIFWRSPDRQLGPTTSTESRQSHATNPTPHEPGRPSQAHRPALALDGADRVV
ncbi:MAG TPA: cellulose synthase catalytic subunit [Solirubrobacteraceae bacterium]|nr:cellulose synthase catalytic subunit [Solirubrobacteraceae bacterium]